MEHILLPTSIEFLEGNTAHVGKVVVTPCTQGYGTTLGNALRRVLLSSLPGAAVDSVKINGVSHEFSAVDGVQEDMIEIILNLKQMAVKLYGDEPIVLTLNKKTIGPVTAGDFQKDSQVEIMNPELVLFNITKSAPVEMEVTIVKGWGYVAAAEKEKKNLDLGTIVIDSLFTPIRDVGYAVELTRLGDVTDYEKLTLTIETNGTVSPKDALSESTKILMDHFALILEATGVAHKIAPKMEKEGLVEEEVTVEESDDSLGEEEKPKSKKKAKK
jgi:DNA-directed RNA polymerase subunit alpha